MARSCKVWGERGRGGGGRGGTQITFPSNLKTVNLKFPSIMEGYKLEEKALTSPRN